jgi:hypothetical protein
MKQRKKKIWRGAALALAVAGIAAPVAQARPHIESWGTASSASSSHSYPAAALRGLALRSEAMNQRYAEIRSESQSKTMSPQELRALTLRSQGMNQRYAEIRSESQSKTLSPQELRALTLRSEGLNQRYGSGSVVVSSSDGFDWSTAGIGAGAVVGTAMLIGAMAVSRRRRGQLAV